MNRRHLYFVSALFASATLASAAAVPLAPSSTAGASTGWQRLSRAGTAFGGSGDAPGDVHMSTDRRYVAFIELMTIGGSKVAEVVRKNLTTGKESLVSVSATGSAAKSDVTAMDMSDDGRYIAFETAADNLVPRDTNRVADVFVRDVLKGTTKRVSVGLRGAQLVTGGSDPRISGDGSTVAFLSADDVFRLPEVVNGSQSSTHLYAITVRTGHLDVVSTAGGHLADVVSKGFAISRNGRLVAFASNGRLTSAAASHSYDVYLKDRVSGSLAMVTGKLSTATTEQYADLSMDGSATWLVFDYSDLSSPQTQSYLVNLKSGAIQPVDGSPVTTADDAKGAAINRAGTYVIYSGGGSHAATDIANGATAPGGSTWHLRRTSDGSIVDVLAAAPSAQANQCPNSGGALGATLSPDGSRVLVITSQPLVSSDTDCASDLYEAPVS